MKPDGSIRRSQLLTGAGPGALVDLIDDAVIIGGLQAWSYESDTEGFIVEPRLQDRALRLLRGMPWWTAGDVRLRRPPECDDSNATRSVGIRASPFPSWFWCQNGQCRSLVHSKGLDEKGRHICTTAKGANAWPVIAVRFASSCGSGHLQDVPWQWFIHRGVQSEDAPPQSGQFCSRVGTSQRKGDPLGGDYRSALYLESIGTTGDLTDLVAGCRHCGARRGLQDLAQKGAMGRCPGRRPWLGYKATEPCTERATLVTRTATNVYFPQVVSVLSIPDPDAAVRAAVESEWSVLQAATAANLSIFRTIPQVARALDGISDSVALAEIERRQKKLPPASPTSIRETEWKALMAAPLEGPGDRPRPGELWFARRLASSGLPSFVDRVVLVHHLREVRAQIGFTRIEGVFGDAEGDIKPDVRTAPLSLDSDWIPAVEILGEGIFVHFNLTEVRDWEKRTEVKARDESFIKAYRLANLGRANPMEFPGVRYAMLHTLSHLLITAISLECGYPATAIRERIYCWRGGDTERAGILLYTGTPGSEGTLGGLVEIGRNIGRHLRSAAEQGLLCSNDPVCAQHLPDNRDERRFREGAACHGCVLIGEPSCERMNQDLDRTLVVPTVESRNAAFLRDWVGGWEPKT